MLPLELLVVEAADREPEGAEPQEHDTHVSALMRSITATDHGIGGRSLITPRSALPTASPIAPGLASVCATWDGFKTRMLAIFDDIRTAAPTFLWGEGQGWSHCAAFSKL
jgi:hypothetical protein